MMDCAESSVAACARGATGDVSEAKSITNDTELRSTADVRIDLRLRIECFIRSGGSGAGFSIRSKCPPKQNGYNARKERDCSGSEAIHAKRFYQE